MNRVFVEKLKRLNFLVCLLCVKSGERKKVTDCRKECEIHQLINDLLGDK